MRYQALRSPPVQPCAGYARLSRVLHASQEPLELQLTTKQQLPALDQVNRHTELRLRANPFATTSSFLETPLTQLRAEAKDQRPEKQAAYRWRRRAQWVVRPTLLATALSVGWTRPIVAARAARLGIAVHLWAPALCLGAAAGRSWRRGPGEPLPRARAELVLSAQHLVSQGALGSIGALMLAAGLPLDVLSFGAGVRVCMLYGLWYWRDLSAELEARPSTLLSPRRLWRSLATALCLMQAALNVRLLAATGVGSQAAAAAALPGELGVAASLLLGAARSAPRLLPDGGGGAAAARLVAAALARGGAIVYALGATWWFCFPAEGGTRDTWRSSLMPDWPPIHTASTRLLSFLRLAREEPTLVELMVAQPRSVAPAHNASAVDLDPRPAPGLMVSPERRVLESPGLPTPAVEESMELLRLLGNEPAFQPNATDTDRERLLRRRDDPANFKWRDGSVLTDAERETHILASYVAPRNPALNMSKVKFFPIGNEAAEEVLEPPCDRSDLQFESSKGIQRGKARRRRTADEMIASAGDDTAVVGPMAAAPPALDDDDDD